MKLILTILLSAFAVLAFGQSGPKAEYDKRVIDLGTFSYHHPKQTARFTVTNTGDEPLVIIKVDTSCGCTVADFTTDLIKPGEKGYVSVTYNGTGRLQGSFRKSLNVYTNDSTKLMQLWIQGTMLYDD